MTRAFRLFVVFLVVVVFVSVVLVVVVVPASCYALVRSLDAAAVSIHVDIASS
jgi:hypothetical protein